MSDDTITFEDGGKVVLTYDRKLDGYQGIMNLEDCIRAYRDRPSMEKELQDLRRWKAHVESWHERVIADRCPKDEIHCGCVPALRSELQELRELVAKQQEEIGRQRARALRYQQELVLGDTVPLEKMCQIADLRAKCQRYEAALREIAKWDYEAYQRTKTDIIDIARNALKGEGEDG